MLEYLFTNPILFFIWAIALLVAITVHEYAHAYMADRLGDPTPRLQGRLTLNPIAHLDPIGTLMMLLVRFGWGKPVQFDPYNLANPRRDAAVISLAGPASNIITATIFAIILRVISQPLSPFSILAVVIPPFIVLNLGLAIFNLIPIHPLDGGKILVGLLPPDDAREADIFLKRYGLFLLLFLMLPIYGGVAPVSYFLTPILRFLYSIYLPGSQAV